MVSLDELVQAKALQKFMRKSNKVQRDDCRKVLRGAEGAPEGAPEPPAPPGDGRLCRGGSVWAQPCQGAVEQTGAGVPFSGVP